MEKSGLGHQYKQEVKNLEYTKKYLNESFIALSLACNGLIDTKVESELRPEIVLIMKDIDRLITKIDYNISGATDKYNQNI